MNAKSYPKLEFDKILEILSGLTIIDSNKKRANELVPFGDVMDLNNALNEVGEAQALIIRRGTPPVNQVSDVIKCVKRLNISGILKEKELLDIAKLLRTARLLLEYSKEDNELSPYFGGLIPLPNLEDDITKKIISEDEIADNASIKLYSIRKKIKNTHDKIREALNRYVMSSEYQKILQESLITMRGDRFVIPVKVEHKGDVPGIVHDTSASGSTVFIEPMTVVKLNNELKELFGEEAREIERILYELTTQAALYTEEITTDYNIITELDFIFAKAKLSIQMKASKPIISSKGIIHLKKARHPLIAPDKVVPIDISIGGEFDSLIITGPNTGGKTVTLKTVGLLCLMGLSGLFIPAFDKSVICTASNIFADIGDEQSISQSLSTFSSHMTNIVSILEEADSDSIVLLDELGAGTDPVEGASLAIGIIEHLRSIGAKVIATTHYSELKLYALSAKGVMNAGCEFDVSTLKPTYRLLIGIPGKSNAFAISEKLGLKEDVLVRARNYLNEDNVKFEDVLNEIEKSRLSLKREQELTAKYKDEVEALKRRLTEQKEKSESKYQRIIEKANNEAGEILRSAKEEADRYLKELKKLRKEDNRREFDRAASKIQADIKNKLKETSTKANQAKMTRPTVDPKALRQGTEIILIDQEQSATVLTPPDAKGFLTVTAGILKIKVHISNVSLDSRGKKQEVEYVQNRKRELKSKSISGEIDIRGQTVIDGVMDVEKYIDDALMLHLEKVSIIHGKGTGALRAAIHQMLKNHPQVKSFRLGVFGEGETGVTIVEFK